MTTRKLTLVLLLALVALLAPASLFAATTRYMVVTRGPAQNARLRVIANSAESIEHRVRTFAHAGSFAADLTDDEAAALRRSPDVESVHPLVRIHALELGPAAGLALDYTKQLMPWGVEAIHAPAVWPVTRGASVNVAVIDSGIDMTHPDLVAAYRGGYNDIDREKPPLDDHGHGTHVAGIIGATDNTTGVVGVAPAVNLWAVKVLASDGSGTDENLVAGLDWVVAKKNEIGGAWVVNMSIGATDGTPAVERAVQRAIDARIIVVAASGNDGSGYLNYPAAYGGVIAVGAVDSNLAIAEFSTYGPGLNVVAPGVDVPSSVARGKFTLTEVEASNQTLPGYAVAGSPKASLNLPFVNCGYGRPEDYPTHVAGRIAVVQRGPIGPNAIPFGEKARNAKDAGAAGVIIYNDDDIGRPDYTRWTLLAQPEWADFQFPLTIAMSHEDGVKVLGASGPITETYRFIDYGRLSGTSMATPHVTGTVALMLALAPADINPATIQWVLEHSTIDVHLEGWDYRSAWGMVDALAAAKLIAPSAFGLPDEPLPPPARRRAARP